MPAGKVGAWGETFESACAWFLTYGAILHWFVSAGENAKKTSGRPKKEDRAHFDCCFEHKTNPEKKRSNDKFTVIAEGCEKYGNVCCTECRQKQGRMYKTFKENLAKIGSVLVDDPSALESRTTFMKTKCKRGHDYTSQSINPGKLCPLCPKDREAKLESKKSSPPEKTETQLMFEKKGFTLIRVEGTNKMDARNCDYVIWTCSSGHENRSRFGSLKMSWYCRSCPRKDSKTLEEFEKLLNEEGYVLVNSDGFENTSSPVLVRCSNGHEYITTYKRFTSRGKSGKFHRCPECTRSKMITVNIEDIRTLCESKGFTLLTQVYIPGEELECLCKCKREVKFSLGNLRANISGCKQCTKRKSAKMVTAELEMEGIVLMDYELSGEFILNSTVLTFPCQRCQSPCSHSYKLYRNGALFCEPCTTRKKAETLLANTGADNPSHVPWFVQKSKKTNMGKRGHEHHMQDPEICSGVHEKMQRNGTRDTKSMNTAKSIKKRTDTDRARNGGVLSINRPDVMKKNRDQPYKGHLVPLPSGEISILQGFEGFALMDMLIFGMPGVCSEMPEYDIKYGGEVPVTKYWDTEKKRRRDYHPDFLTPYGPVEVKAEYTFQKNFEMNESKFFQATMDYGVMYVWIYNQNGTRNRILTYTSDGADGIIVFEDFDSARTEPKTEKRAQFPLVPKKKKKVGKFSAIASKRNFVVQQS